MTRLAILALALAACAPRLGGRAAPRVEGVAIAGASFRLVYLREDAEAAADVKAILAEAVPRTRRWGTLRAPVTITIHPTHEALEAAIHRGGLPWLRAWARYATIDLQAPRTWSPVGYGRALLAELLLHELTHCVMYQSVATELSWTERDVPLWFREGLASVTAAQGHRRVGPESIWRFYAGGVPAVTGVARGAEGSGGGAQQARPRRAGDPITDPEPLYRSDSALVYAAAHLAFEFLLDRYGEARVRQVLANMERGDAFGAAFREAIGIEHDRFEREFRRYIQWQGWRRGD